MGKERIIRKSSVYQLKSNRKQLYLSFHEKTNQSASLSSFFFSDRLLKSKFSKFLAK